MALEREKNKLVLEKCQDILKNLLKDEDNKYCVDCDAKSPRWASWNIGIFLCIRCAGIHRNLGVHISKVKSVNLDTWTPQQVACIQQMGNSRARAVYEANLQDNFRRPQTDSSLEQFIRAKYEAKKYIAKEWVPPPLPNPSWDVEIESQLKKKREKKSSGGNVEFPAIPSKNAISKSGGASPKPLPKAPGGRNNSPNQSKRSSGSALSNNKENSSGTADLLGLDMQAPSTTTTTTNGAVESDGDIFGDFLTAPAAPSPARSTPEEGNITTQNEESNFFNQKLPEASSEKMSKDSILALYSQTPTHPVPQQPMFGGGGGVGMFMGGPSVPGAIPHSGLIPNPQQPNMMLYQQQQQQQKGVNAGAVQGTYFPQAMPQAQMYPGMAGVPHNMPGTAVGVQLSAANPFAQMQSQLGSLNLGGMMPVQPQHGLGSNQGMMMSGGSMMMSSGMSSNPSQHNALSANQWQ